MSGSHQKALIFSDSGFRVRHLFPTPFVVAPVEDCAALNAALLEAITARAAAHPGVCRSNAGGWQSRDDFAAWSGAAGQQLLDAVGRLADQMTGVQEDEDGDFTRRPIAWRINAWANVNGPGHANHAHHHPASFWSAVYWVEDGRGTDAESVGGEFEMQDPRGILPAFHAPRLRYAVPGCLSAGLSDFLVPRSGTLVLFPSWLVHAVRPYRGTGRRVSVAFNLAP